MKCLLIQKNNQKSIKLNSILTESTHHLGREIKIQHANFDDQKNLIGQIKNNNNNNKKKKINYKIRIRSNSQMIYSKLDLFSSQFQFNINNQQMKKGTLFGFDTFLQIVKETQLKNQENFEQNQLEKDQQTNAKNNLIQQKQNQIQEEEVKGYEEKEPTGKITVPAFKCKYKQSLDLESVSPSKFNKIDQEGQEIKDFAVQVEKLEELTDRQNDVQNLENNIYKEELTSSSQQQNTQRNKFYYIQDSVIQQFQQGDLLTSQHTEENQSFSPYKSSLLQSQFKKNSISGNISNYQHRSQQQNKNNVEFNTKIVKNIELKMKNMENLQDKKLSDKLIEFIFKMRVFKKKKELIGGLKESQLKQIEYQIHKDLDILNFVKDVLFLKKAIMLVFDPDQLAALQLIGCSQHFLDQKLSDLEQDANFFENDSNLSFYEKQFAVSQSEKLQQHFMKRFLNKCSKKTNFNELDERILSSLKN
ncbi:hypothetical protein ABPG73_008914 [Tetrahymena malaccensis]